MPIIIRVVRQKQKGLGLRSLRTESLYILHIINCIHFFYNYVKYITHGLVIIVIVN